MQDNKTKNFIGIDKWEYIGVKHYLIPDTQRDAINQKTRKLEAHNHCKSTSCTMAWNALAKILGEQFPRMRSMEYMGETAYGDSLAGYLQFSKKFNRPEKIQDWDPHVRMFNDLFQKNGIPLVAQFGLYKANEMRVINSLAKGFPVPLGTEITGDGHIVLFYRKVKIEGIDFNVIIDPYGNPLTKPKYKNTTADYYCIPQKEWNTWITPICNCIWFEIRGDFKL